MNRLLPQARWFVAALAAAVAGCAGGVPIEVPAAGTASEIPAETLENMPSAATFAANVEPFLEAQNCGSGGCHLAPTGGGNYNLVTQAPADAAANYQATACANRIVEYGAAPQGLMVDYFCDGPGAPNAGHNGKSMTAAECTALFDWLSEGTGPAPDC